MTKEAQKISMTEAVKTIQAEQEARMEEFQSELHKLQKRLGIQLEIHQLIVPVLKPGRSADTC
tara:strand:- start:138 stop:326 length:189 start_codon:yes stop_codon:yes gene_type:complete